MVGRMDRQTEILALIGKIVAQWNYAEHCSRQIIRKRITGGHIDNKDHIHLSKQPAKWMEDQLRDEVLPRWRDAPGAPYLKSLIAAFSAAREFRNYYVHGIFATLPETPDGPAQALVIPSKPHNNKMQAPKFVTAADLFRIADHLEKLGAFACDVGSAFDGSGQRATNNDQSPVAAELPPVIAPLPPFPYASLEP